jgi:hypothetical protein
MILIGSQAAKFLHNDFRVPKDYDFVGTLDEFQKIVNSLSGEISIEEKLNKRHITFLKNEKKCHLEFELVGSQSTQLLSQTSKKIGNIFDIDLFCPSTEILYLMKKSHLFWNIHWEKSIEDMYWLYARSQPINFMEKAFYSARLKENKEKHDDLFFYDISKYKLNDFKKKILLMTEERLGNSSKDNIIKNLKYIATNKKFGASREFVIENYQNILT